MIESEIREKKTDIKTEFLKLYANNCFFSSDQVSKELLEKQFDTLQKQSQDNIKRQDTLMAEIQKNHEQFVKENGGGSNARDDMLKKLAAANDAYFELKGNLQEGTKFYNDLTQLLVTFQSKVTDFCFARRTEKEELLKDLTSGMSSLTIGATPTPPSHHTPTAPGDEVCNNPERPARKADDRPARPPPPVTTATTNPYAGAPPTTQAPNPYPGAPTSTNPYAGAPG